MNNKIFIPHPFPYQGSKRNIASQIIPYIPQDTPRIIEPFCGTGAISIACAAYGIANEFVLNDLNKSLICLWESILNNPEQLVFEYQTLWLEQQTDSRKFFLEIRNQFNKTGLPHYFLYLLARIVKGSVRYNSNGEFNQSADNRRLGMKPELMKKNLLALSDLMRNKTSLFSLDFSEIIAKSTNSTDIIYLDPPYQGTSGKKDHRYVEGLSFEYFVDVLHEMNQKNKMFIISYDGITGTKIHGKKLPDFLRLRHLYINAGKSSQETLLGRTSVTFESLYLSEALQDKLELSKQDLMPKYIPQSSIQQPKLRHL